MSFRIYRVTFSILFCFICFFVSAQNDSTTRNILGFTPSKFYRINGLVLGIWNKPGDKLNKKINGFNLELIGNGWIAPFLPLDDANYIKSTKNSQKINGISLGLTLFNGKVNGLSIAPIINTTYFVNGLKLSLVNVDWFKTKGVQAGLINIGSKIIGINFGIFNLHEDEKGVGIGLLNANENDKGLTIGLYNLSSSTKGVQIGLYNKTDKLKGIQIGLINKNESRTTILFNWSNKKDSITKVYKHFIKKTIQRNRNNKDYKTIKKAVLDSFKKLALISSYFQKYYDDEVAIDKLMFFDTDFTNAVLLLKIRSNNYPENKIDIVTAKKIGKVWQYRFNNSAIFQNANNVSVLRYNNMDELKEITIKILMEEGLMKKDKSYEIDSDYIRNKTKWE